jgi:hypothetical protein
MLLELKKKLHGNTFPIKFTIYVIIKLTILITPIILNTCYAYIFLTILILIATKSCAIIFIFSDIYKIFLESCFKFC